MCFQHDFQYYAEHLSICRNCGLEDRRPFILTECDYTFRALRYPPYSRTMRFGPLTDHLPHPLQRKVLDLYGTILSRWHRLNPRRSRYFYNRRLMFRFLFCKVTGEPFTNVLQNLESQSAQISEMEYLLTTDPPPKNPVPELSPMAKIWAMFDE